MHTPQDLDLDGHLTHIGRQLDTIIYLLAELNNAHVTRNARGEHIVTWRQDWKASNGVGVNINAGEPPEDDDDAYEGDTVRLQPHGPLHQKLGGLFARRSRRAD